MPRSAGDLVREARRRAGLTQAELGRRAGLAQSVVSAYESGSREPSVPMLVDLVHAAGFTVEINLAERRHGDHAPMHGVLGRRVRRHARRIRDLATAHGVENVRVFGSVARGQERPDSDVDVLVDVPSGVGLFALGRLQDDLERLLRAPVDVVPVDSLKPDVRTQVELDAVAL